MATYGGAVTQIISELGRSITSITAIVEQEVLSAVDYYASTRFWFNEARATFTTSSGQSTYTGTTGILEIDSLVITISGAKYELRPENYAVLNALDLGTVNGQPTTYAYWQEAIRLYPVPNASFTVAIEYQQRFATLSLSTESNAFLTHGLDMIKARVQKNVSALRFKDREQAQACAMLENNAFERLIMQTERLTSTGRLSPG